MSERIQFGTALRKLRSKEAFKEMRYEDFARTIGVSRATLWRYENGEMSPDMQIRGRVARLASEFGGKQLAEFFLEPFSAALGAAVGDLHRLVKEREAA